MSGLEQGPRRALACPISAARRASRVFAPFPQTQIDRIETIDGDELKFSDDIRFSTESYEIV